MTDKKLIVPDIMEADVQDDVEPKGDGPRPRRPEKSYIDTAMELLEGMLTKETTKQGWIQKIKEDELHTVASALMQAASERDMFARTMHILSYELSGLTTRGHVDESARPEIANRLCRQAMEHARNQLLQELEATREGRDMSKQATPVAKPRLVIARH